jgi:septal ring factor EnvC (AmiA/AmiB activator)
MRKFLAVFCVLLATLASAQTKAPVAKSSAEAEKKIEALRKEIKTLSKAQQEVEEKRNLEAKQLRQIDQKVAVSSQNLTKIEGAINGQENKLDRLETEQQRMERNLGEQKIQLTMLLRSAYRLGDNSELKHLLSQDKLSEVARWMVYHRYFEQERQYQITGLSVQIKQLAAASLVVEQEKNILAKQKMQQQKAANVLGKQRQERSVAVSTLDAKYKTQQAKIKALGKDEKALRNLLDKLRQAAVSSKAPTVVGRPSNAKTTPRITPKNLTGWPLTGSLIAGYGNAMPDGRNSEGLLIAAPAGTSVYSVAAGRVVYADWLKGYGMLMVIDHGRGYMSLFANNDALIKEVGDSVTAGERIATVGSSGGQGRTALYFEMRLNGQPQNPNAWLRP